MQAFERLESDTSKLVVLYLHRVGDATPDRIAERLRLPLLTVLATVRHLDEVGIVRRLDGSDRVVLADRARERRPPVERTPDAV